MSTVLFLDSFDEVELEELEEELSESESDSICLFKFSFESSLSSAISALGARALSVDCSIAAVGSKDLNSSVLDSGGNESRLDTPETLDNDLKPLSIFTAELVRLLVSVPFKPRRGVMTVKALVHIVANAIFDTYLRFE